MKAPYLCMGKEVWEATDGGGAFYFSQRRFPFFGSAQQQSRTRFEWQLRFNGDDRPIADGRAATLHECALAIDGARLDALAELAKQLEEVT